MPQPTGRSVFYRHAHLQRLDGVLGAGLLGLQCRHALRQVRGGRLERLQAVAQVGDVAAVAAQCRLAGVQPRLGGAELVALGVDADLQLAQRCAVLHHSGLSAAQLLLRAGTGANHTLCRHVWLLKLGAAYSTGAARRNASVLFRAAAVSSGEVTHLHVVDARRD